jgi:hypothetical protein
LQARFPFWGFGFETIALRGDWRRQHQLTVFPDIGPSRRGGGDSSA